MITFFMLLTFIESNIYHTLYSLIMTLPFIISEKICNKNYQIFTKNNLINFISLIILINIGDLIVKILEVYIDIFEIKESYLENPLLYISAHILINDIFYYWYHKAQHRFSLLWNIHKLHHTDTAMNSLTAHRTHYIEAPIQFLLISLPVSYILGYNLDALKFMFYIYIFLLIYTHSNLSMSHGILSKLFVSPTHHRIHHSQLRNEQNSNFAQYISFLDYIFGTYKKSDRKNLITTGLSQNTNEKQILNSLIWPFKIWK